MKSNNPKDFVANYELNSYRYSDFWKGREYEHAVEVQLLTRVLNKHLSDLSSREIVDLGGAYGRLLPIYGERAKHVILADYSTNELMTGLGNIVQSPLKSKIDFVALNAYKMPFSDASIDSLISVRVMHHLKEINLFIAELSRVLKPGGKAVIEFANKNHIISIVRHILKLDIFSYLREGVVQIMHRGDAQGINEGQVSIMYNFSHAYVKELAKQNGLKVEASYSCSFLRNGFMKRNFSVQTLLKVETILEKILGWARITPSVFVVLQKEGNFIATTDSAVDHLACPTCNKKMNKIAENILQCENGHTFPQTKLNIIDLRDPRPEEIDF